jgi:hypothetical protein
MQAGTFGGSIVIWMYTPTCSFSRYNVLGWCLMFSITWQDLHHVANW